MLNGNEMKAFYRIFFPKRPGEGGPAARVPDVNETRLNDNFKTISDEFRKIWEFIKNGFKTKSLTVDGDASIGGNASIGGQLSAGSAALGDTNVNGALDVDGSVTIGGTLSVANRNAYGTLAGAGWYRVFTVKNQARASRAWKADICITRTYRNQSNELHSIKLLSVYDSFEFAEEISKTNVLQIDKIRYTRNGSTGYVDIHYTHSLRNEVSVDYSISTSPDLQASFTTNSLSAVADSPSGETVLAEYSFGKTGTFIQDINGFLNAERITIANGATGAVAMPSLSSAYLLMTGVNAKCLILCAARSNSSGIIYHGETIIGSGTIGATFSTSTNTLSITNSSGNELQILILRF